MLTTPSPKCKGEKWVGLPASAAAKVLLLNELVQQQVKASELARRLETSPQAVDRLIDLRHATEIDATDWALHALGRRLQASLTA